ncbi:hypothetical protein ACFFF5_18340 [Lederbergia wuyishanensis]|uniref:Uncharacterized protein n=1 Tax=Lederbergia wuyishanensis TaxID=1347903 RepID=A0ABU0D979_9BACI|nr:hypothetical protein [Lederbergia wuyishanensis]MCJ8009405.1 hypothetical protein [Lederbergia wuyishanensis]MDQ0344986.1 hypothetical protein [Lederbergia wuyishanensis]
MRLTDAFRKVHNHYTLILIPIIYDFISLGLGLLLVGFNGKEMLSSRLILEMGIPSASHLSNIPLFANHVDLLHISDKGHSFSWIVIVVMIIIGAFLQGGYISFLHSIVIGNDFRFSSFLKDGRKNWIQFIFLHMIVFLGKISVTAFLVIFFNIIGVFASLVIFLILRIIYIYLEFTIVVDRVSVAKALKLSNVYLKRSLPFSLCLIIVMYIFSSSISLMLHRLWSPITIIGTIVVYSYLMSIMQIAFMSLFCRLKKAA